MIPIAGRQVVRTTDVQPLVGCPNCLLSSSITTLSLRGTGMMLGTGYAQLRRRVGAETSPGEHLAAGEDSRRGW
jgi:hypothetical protein